MTSAVQVQYRRGNATQIASFTGAQGEMVVDTTNNRVVIQDGCTAGGFPAAKLSEVQTNTRTQVSDGNYAAQPTDRLIAYIAITAARTVSLPAASTFPGGSWLLVVDESGACSATNTITLSANGSDTIDGASSAFIQSAFGYVALESNTSNKWTIVDATNGVALTAPTITGGTINNAPIGGSVPAAGSFTTVAVARHAVADANYTVAAGVSIVAYTSITAARTVSLPAASSFPAGARLVVVDESGGCSTTKTITVSANGSDTIGGAATAALAAAYAGLVLECNGSNKWAVLAQTTALQLNTVAQGPNGSQIQIGILEQLLTLSGASTTSTIQIPNRAIVFAVSELVVTAVTGAPSFGVGVSGNTTQFGGSLGVSAGSNNSGVIGPTAFYSPTSIIVTATSGSFTGGTVRISIQYMLCPTPTS